MTFDNRTTGNNGDMEIESGESPEHGRADSRSSNIHLSPTSFNLCHHRCGHYYESVCQLQGCEAAYISDLPYVREEKKEYVPLFLRRDE